MNVIHVTSEEERAKAFAVRTEVFVHEQQIPIEIEIDEFEEVCDHFVVVDHEERAVGAGRLRNVNGDGKVERICTLKERRGEGIGKLLMIAIEDVARKKRFEKLILNAQRQAVPFYASLGYEIVSDEFMEVGIPHVTMVKTL